MERQGKGSRQPVTALLVRVIRPERAADFEVWLQGMNQIVRRFEGYLGTDVIRPRDHSHPEYVIVVRFDGYEHLRDWMGSPERDEWLKKSEEMTIGEIHVQEAHGFQPWFTPPDRSATSIAPAKYKMALLTILALYPPLLALSTLLSYVLHGWPRPLLMFATVALLVPAMTYAIMPWVTQLFRSWLYPASGAG